MFSDESLKEGRDNQQMSPKLLNKRSQQNICNVLKENTIRSLMTPCFQHIKQACSSWHGTRDTHTHSQNNYCNPCVCADPIQAQIYICSTVNTPMVTAQSNSSMFYV